MGRGLPALRETGRIARREELSVYVPRKGNKGDKLKVNDKGGEGLNGSSSDISTLLSPRLATRFSRNGADVGNTQLVSADLLARRAPHHKNPPWFTQYSRTPKFSVWQETDGPRSRVSIMVDPDQIGKLTICLKAIAS